MVNLFVSGFPYAVIDSHLVQCFKPFGTVERAQVVRHRTGDLKGKSRGFGFVEMTDPVEAAAAIKALNGSVWGGRTLHVQVSESHHRPAEQSQGTATEAATETASGTS